jgi:hypothetical protein
MWNKGKTDRKSCTVRSEKREPRYNRGCREIICNSFQGYLTGNASRKGIRVKKAMEKEHVKCVKKTGGNDGARETGMCESEREKEDAEGERKFLNENGVKLEWMKCVNIKRRAPSCIIFLYKPILSR